MSRKGAERGLIALLFGLALAETVLHEPVTTGMLGITVCVILCVVGARRFGR
jgi:hypothetical protein